MSFEAMAIVFHHSKADGTALHVLMGIANHQGDGGAWPSMATLAKYGRCSERQARRHVSRLVDMGELAVDYNQGGLGGVPDYERPNRYEVLLACPATCDRTMNHREVRSADLWTNPRTPVTGGDTSDRGEGSPVSGDPRSSVSAEPVPRTSTTHPYQNGEGGASVDSASEDRCDVCSRRESDCRRIGPERSGHEFSPARKLRSV